MTAAEANCSANLCLAGRDRQGHEEGVVSRERQQVSRVGPHPPSQAAPNTSGARHQERSRDWAPMHLLVGSEDGGVRQKPL